MNAPIFSVRKLQPKAIFSATPVVLRARSQLLRRNNLSFHFHTCQVSPNFDCFVQLCNRNKNPLETAGATRQSNAIRHQSTPLPVKRLKSIVGRPSTEVEPVSTAATLNARGNSAWQKKIAPSAKHPCLTTLGHILLVKCRRSEHCYAQQYSQGFLEKAASATLKI